MHTHVDTGAYLTKCVTTNARAGVYAVEHGALSIDDHDNRITWPPILELVIPRGTVSTIKLLGGEYDAPMGSRVFILLLEMRIYNLLSRTGSRFGR